MTRFKALAAGLLAASMALVARAEAPNAIPFLPSGLATGNSPSAHVKRATFDTNGGSGFQISAPLNTAVPFAQNSQYWITNKSLTSAACVAVGPTQGSVASVVVPTAGTNTIGTGGNCFSINPGNTVTVSFPPNYWFNAVAESGTVTLEFMGGSGY